MRYYLFLLTLCLTSCQSHIYQPKYSEGEVEKLPISSQNETTNHTR